MPIRLVEPDSAERWIVARDLVDEYAASLGVDLGFQDFDHERVNLSREYGSPHGVFLLAERDTTILGCGALRTLSDGVCEMKRLYVTPAGRGSGVGRALAEGLIARARRLGYERMRLDTLPSMTRAQALYRTLGFEPIAAYRHNPILGTTFLELRL